MIFLIKKKQILQEYRNFEQYTFFRSITLPMRLIQIILFLLISHYNFAQVKIVKEKSNVTGQENEWKIVGKDAIVVRDSGSHYIQIHIRETKNILYGNRCAEVAAQKMGVEFIIIPKDIGFGMKLKHFFGTNLNGYIRAFFKNGFLWRKRLKKKIQQCRETTGDYIR